MYIKPYNSAILKRLQDCFLAETGGIVVFKNKNSSIECYAINKKQVTLKL